MDISACWIKLLGILDHSIVARTAEEHFSMKLRLCCSVQRTDFSHSSCFALRSDCCGTRDHLLKKKRELIHKAICLLICCDCSKQHVHATSPTSARAGELWVGDCGVGRGGFFLWIQMCKVGNNLKSEALVLPFAELFHIKCPVSHHCFKGVLPPRAHLEWMQKAT